MTINRKVKPQPTKEINFSLPEIKHHKLENGLNVLFVEKQNLPMIQLNLVADAGSKFDAENKKGNASLFAMMIDEGAGKYNSMELSDEFDEIGANFSISRNCDSIYLSLQSLTEKFDRALDLLSTVVNEPHFNKEDFERERKKTLIRILQTKDDPSGIADNASEFIVFGKDNPYAYPATGYEDAVNSLTVDDVINFYKDNFTPDRSALIVVGNINFNKLIDKLNSTLNNWKGRSHKELSFPEAKNIKRKIYIVDKKNAPQSEIRVVHKATKRNEYDYFSKTILNTILGGQFSSRINLNLREDKGYTYGAQSRFNHYKNDAFFYVSTSVSEENTANAVKEIYTELNKIRKGITPEELEFAKSSIIRKFPSNFETYNQIASNLMGKIIHSLPDEYFDNFIDNIKRIAIDDVNQAAVDNIFPDKLSIVVTGPKDKLRNKLETLDIGEVLEADINGRII